jgi:hypothetical protein
LLPIELLLLGEGLNEGFRFEIASSLSDLLGLEKPKRLLTSYNIKYVR